MEGLMFICKKWGTAACDPRIMKLRYFQEKKPGEKIVIWPIGEELRKLDEICKNCDNRLFKFEEMECPLCKNKDIQLQGYKEVEFELGCIKGKFYKCNKCDTELIFEK